MARKNKYSRKKKGFSLGKLALVAIGLYLITRKEHTVEPTLPVDTLPPLPLPAGELSVGNIRNRARLPQFA